MRDSVHQAISEAAIKSVCDMIVWCTDREVRYFLYETVGDVVYSDLSDTVSQAATVVVNEAVYHHAVGS